ncbi:MAG: 4Fe-4S binding protein, partial [Deltaproteobacteria bacterium]|nr:4Fe-4S binding protein [Deltaproteobacteria bacterium]
IEIPVADESKCTYCRKCSDLCQFAAVKVLGEVLMVFPEMCHGCGGCIAICPEGALTPGERELGDIIWGKAGKVDFIMGRSRVGEAMSPPLMRQVKTKLADIAPAGTDVIIDAPPGVSCPAVNAVMDADAIVLVTEPTPFGVFDLGLAHKAFAPMGKPMGVVVNRAGIGTDEVYRFCRRNGLEIFAEIPYDRAIAEAYAEGRIVAEAVPSAGEILTDLGNRLRRLVGDSSAKEASRV